MQARAHTGGPPRRACQGFSTWIVTDWVAGGVFHVAPDGSAEAVLDLPPGSADLEYLPDERIVVVPMMLDGTVVAHRLD
jgi:hypothetical protein